MTRVLLGALMLLGIAFTAMAYVEADERKKMAEWEKYEEWRAKLP